jgi:hypothetical protein
MRALLAACGGFLLAVLWFDLMFDVQVRGHPPAPAPLPAATLASIATYYARVTTDAHPMQRLIALVMATAVLGSAWGVWRSPRRPLAWLALACVLVPVALAAVRVLPNAVQLGTGLGSPEERSVLARAIFRDHVACLIAIAAFTALQIAAFSRTSSRARRGPAAAAPP